MVEEKLGVGYGQIIEGGHGFPPFGKVVDSDGDVLVATIGGRPTFHKFYAPFEKGSDRDDWMEGRKWYYGFSCVNLEISAMFDDSNEVMKEWRPNVTGSHDLKGSGHYGEMATISIGMEIIKDSLNLFMGEAMAKYGVHSLLV